MKSKITLSLASLAAVFLVGCASPGQRTATATPVLMGSIEQVPAPVPAAPTSVAAPAPDLPQRNPFASEPVPIMTQPKVQRMVVKPHIDANGNLVTKPQEIIVVMEEAKFNPAALKNPSGTYIPPENIAPLPGAGTYTVSRSQVNAGVRSVDLAPAEPQHLHDPSNVVITGLMQRSQEVEARAMADQTSTSEMQFFASYDLDLGWLLLPETVLQPVSRPTAAVSR